MFNVTSVVLLFPSTSKVSVILFLKHIKEVKVAPVHTLRSGKRNRSLNRTHVCGVSHVERAARAV